jgi:hypothetical protein
VNPIPYDQLDTLFLDVGKLIDPFGDWKDVDCERVRDLEELSRKIIAAQG